MKASRSHGHLWRRRNYDRRHGAARAARARRRGCQENPRGRTGDAPVRGRGTHRHRRGGDSHTKELLRQSLEATPGVERVVPILQPFKLVSREFKPENAVVEVSGVRFGDGAVTVIAGPCSVESLEQIVATAKAVKAAGAVMLRGGAFKPRTSPYSFQGLEEEGL